jgi:hypothetical protein
MNIENILSQDDFEFLAARHIDRDLLNDILNEHGERGLRAFLAKERQSAQDEAEAEREQAKTAATEDDYFDFLDTCVHDLKNLYMSKGWTVTHSRGSFGDSRYITVERDESMLVVRVSDHDQPRGGSWRKSSTGAEGREEADVCFKVPTLDAYRAGDRQIIRTK